MLEEETIVDGLSQKDRMLAGMPYAAFVPGDSTAQLRSPSYNEHGLMSSACSHKIATVSPP